MSTPRSPDRQPASLTSPRGRQWRVALLLALSCGLASAAEGAATAEIERIARERAAVEHKAQVEQAACAQRFAVTSCIERVKAERRERLLQLNRERAAVDDERRKQRAAERAADPQQGKAEPATPALSRTAREPKPTASAPAASLAPRRAAAAARRELAASQAQAAAARRAEASLRRATQAQAHRENVERRNQHKAASKAPGKPLPVPTAASANQ